MYVNEVRSPLWCRHSGKYYLANLRMLAEMFEDYFLSYNIRTGWDQFLFSSAKLLCLYLQKWPSIIAKKISPLQMIWEFGRTRSSRGSAWSCMSSFGLSMSQDTRVSGLAPLFFFRSSRGPDVAEISIPPLRGRARDLRPDQGARWVGERIPEAGRWGSRFCCEYKEEEKASLLHLQLKALLRQVSAEISCKKRKKQLQLSVVARLQETISVLAQQNNACASANLHGCVQEMQRNGCPGFYIRSYSCVHCYVNMLCNHVRTMGASFHNGCCKLYNCFQESWVSTTKKSTLLSRARLSGTWQYVPLCTLFRLLHSTAPIQSLARSLD